MCGNSQFVSSSFCNGKKDLQVSASNNHMSYRAITVAYDIVFLQAMNSKDLEVLKTKKYVISNAWPYSAWFVRRCLIRQAIAKLSCFPV